jgi:hypothetical protein
MNVYLRNIHYTQHNNLLAVLCIGRRPNVLVFDISITLSTRPLFSDVYIKLLLLFAKLKQNIHCKQTKHLVLPFDVARSRLDILCDCREIVLWLLLSVIVDEADDSGLMAMSGTTGTPTGIGWCRILDVLLFIDALTQRWRRITVIVQSYCNVYDCFDCIILSRHTYISTSYHVYIYENRAVV